MSRIFFILALIVCIPCSAFAAPPGSPYTPGETLDPSCSPGSSNCTVTSIQPVANGGTGTTSFGQGWLFSSGDESALSASSSPTVNYITATSTTATSTFANGINVTGGCFSINGVCIGTVSSSDLQHAASYDTGEAMTNIPTGGSQTILGIVSVTPTSATGDVYVTGWADVYSSNGTDQPLQLVIETSSDCTGSAVGNASVTYDITSGASTANVRGTIRVSGIAVDPGASAQSYSLCAAVTSGGGDSDIMNWGIEAIVIDTGADVAEIYSTNDVSIEAGDLVSIDPFLKAGVKKNQGAYDQNVLGIVSTRPGTLIGGVDKEGASAVPVALSGRVPVKVVTENGAIEPGDYLVSSSVPGAAMKAQGRGHVIGQAIGSFDGTGVGTIIVFIKNFDFGEGAGLLGNVSSSSISITAVQSEHASDPVAAVGKKIADGVEFITDLVVARITAIRGYFDEVFSKKVHTDELCFKKSDDSEICVDGDHVQVLLENVGVVPVVNALNDDNPVASDEPNSANTSPAISDEVVDTSTTTTEVQSVAIEPVPTETLSDIPQTTSEASIDEAEVTAPIEMQTMPPSGATFEPTL